MLDLIINVEELDQETPAIRLGMAIAKRQDGFVTGLHVVAVYPSIMAIPEAWAALDTEEQAAHERTGWWQDLCERNGVRGEWEVLRGLFVPVLARRSRMADLVISMSPAGTADLPLGFDNITRTLFADASPMLLVPAGWAGTTAPDRVLIAWNDSGEATDAIRSALPLLRMASQVHVLEGEREPGVEGLEAPPLPLLDWLERQGVKVQRRQVFDGRHVGKTLLDEAEAMHADLLVMGAWGRSRFSELVLGGTTHHVLEHARLPLLLGR